MYPAATIDANCVKFTVRNSVSLYISVLKMRVCVISQLTVTLKKLVSI